MFEFSLKIQFVTHTLLCIMDENKNQMPIHLIGLEFWINTLKKREFKSKTMPIHNCY